ncbi:MAG: threonine ammonia-lyase [Bdellovibrionales bacterium]|jgi:threonine dehydratase|nr:threonine ammonia-lyase [Bdellovibrionales bacterium]
MGQSTIPADKKTDNQAVNEAVNQAVGESLAITLEDIRRAREVLQNRVRRTELREVPFPIARAPKDSQVFLKFENEQLTGSFKIRGALNTMLSLSKEERERGIVASSAGNHAQGVAYGAKVVGAKAHICMPVTAPIVKVNATKSHGADVILHGEVYDDAYAKALELEKEKGWIFVHPYLDSRVIAGQGTIGLEILEDLPNVDTLVVPIGGGGLISGIAIAAKALKPSIRVVGVVSDQAPMMMRLFKGESFEAIQAEKKAQLAAGIAPKRVTTIAEGIAIKNASPVMFETHIKRLVDDIVQVNDNEVAAAIVSLLEKAKTVTEGSGAAGLAAVMAGKVTTAQPGGQVAVVLCGGNIDLNVMSRVIESGLRHYHRLARIAVVVDDLPGNLNRITAVMAEERANVLEVHHDRVSPQLGLRETRIDLLVETSNQEQIKRLHERLMAQGFRVLQ